MKVRNRVAASAAGVLIGCLIAVEPARADHRPVIAVPGNPEVPVVIDGVPATGALVEGDWGLYAPGRVAPRVYAPAFVPIAPVFVSVAPEPGYYPKTGRRPRYGRHEVFLPRHVPPPAPSFYREWSVEPSYGPVTEYPPFDPPPVILAPRRRH